MRMVVDVMGGDHGPGVVIDGARLALQSHSVHRQSFFWWGGKMKSRRG